MLLYISVYHEFIHNTRDGFPKDAKISRASTTITLIVIVVLARDMLVSSG